MKTAFIASEYNPFHNGHQHHILQTRKNGADYVVCVMSGNFVQRGTIAVAEKHLRAKWALLAGADLVIELPIKYAVSTASLFAEGFIKTAKATGLEGFISFGAKHEIDKLTEVQRIIYSKSAEEYAAKCLTKGISYPRAKALYLLENSSHELCDVLDDANNILALEYLNARDRFFVNAGVKAIKRTGAMHDSTEVSDEYASASYLRKLLYRDIALCDEINNVYDCKEFIPDVVFDEILKAYSGGLLPASVQKFDTVAFARLTDMTSENFSKINNVVGGLENRITEAIRRTASVNDLCDYVKSKAFTHSRIRQIILNAVLGITREDISNGISYIRVLGFNDKGRTLLNRIKESSSLPVLTNLSQADADNKKIERDVFIDYYSGKLFNLCLPCPIKGNPEYDIPPVNIN